MRVPLVHLASLHAPLQAELEAAAQRVIRSGRYILGPEVEALEAEVAALCGVRYGIGVASGTDALMLSLVACGIQAGDEVITSPFTYVATTQAITARGAKPVFVDIDPRTFNLDPQRVEAAITPRTRALMPVHLYGQCADMETLQGIAQRHGLALIEDAAQAIGAQIRGRGIGSWGQTAALSFYPTKNLGALGDGGMVLTNDGELADRLRLLRFHGRRSGYIYESDGYNSRLDELQAALLRVKLRWLPQWMEQRRRYAEIYREHLAPFVETPYVPPGHEPVYHQFVIRTPQRDALRAWLQERGIETAIFYPLPLHLQPIYAHLGYREGDFPEAERAAREVLCLPISPEVGEENILYVAESILAFFQSR